MQRIIGAFLIINALLVISCIPLLFKPMRDNIAILLSLAPFMGANLLALALVGKDVVSGLAERADASR